MTTETSGDGTDGSATHAPTGRLYHGTRDELRPGDLVAPTGSGTVSVSPNLDAAIWDAELAMRDALPGVYVVETDGPIVDACGPVTAIWAAELALGQGPERICVVEPTGPIGDDPNGTDKKLRENPPKSSRSHHPLRVAGELTKWKGHSKDAIAATRAALQNPKPQGVVPVDD